MSTWSAERMSRRDEFEARVVPSVDNTPRRRVAPDSWRHDSSSFSSPTLSPVSPPPPIRPVAVARRRTMPSTAPPPPVPPPPPPPEDVSVDDSMQRAWAAAVTHPADSWRRSWHARSAALAAPTHPELFNANNYNNQFASVQRSNTSPPKPLMSVTVNNNYLPDSQGPSKQKKKRNHRRRGSAGNPLASLPTVLPEEVIHVRSEDDQNSLARCLSAAGLGSREQTTRTRGGSGGSGGDLVCDSRSMTISPPNRNGDIAQSAGRFASLARPESMETTSPPRPAAPAVKRAPHRVRPRPLTPLPRSSIVVTGEAGPPAPTRRQWTALPSVRELLDGTADCVDMDDPRSPPPSPARREFFVQLAVFQAEHAGMYPDWYAQYRDKCQ